ncbi:DUF7687 domain-containing protein [Bacteroides sedimenti]|uniref:Uncharacterized protein n=1 Tax=Bacteroides sedimenti TaxID=2136147 RepID=A0ABN6ZCH7_9BACE
MRANESFLGKPLDFWANIRLLNQKLGYVETKSKKNPDPQGIVPTIDDVKRVYAQEGLDCSGLINDDKWTQLGNEIIAYLQYRSGALQFVKSKLMEKEEAKSLFDELKRELNPSCPLPMNKQTGDKNDFAFLTGIVNMLVESSLKLKSSEERVCDYDPRSLTSIRNCNGPIRTLSRRLDGAYPSIINPKAIWEIKEYYYTTTFGSRVADGVYETQLDGWELWEIRSSLGIHIDHYLIIDDYFTWWEKGKSYLCRIIDLLHMGLLTEALFGKEVITRIPELVSSW